MIFICYNQIVKWLIYKHTSPSGKVYIGQTMQTNPQNRWQHGNGYKRHNTLFYKAIQKYGWNNFSHEIIENNILTQHEANEREIYWISFYNSFKNGYNATPGGNMLGDNVVSKPVIQIEIDKPTIVYKKFKSAREAERLTGICGRNIGACCLKQGQISAGGYYWCFEDDFKFFKPQIKRYANNSVRRKIYCFETDSVFESIVEASNKLNISRRSIWACCNNKQMSISTCHFCYYEDKDNYEIKINNNGLYQLNKNSYKIIHEFTNMADAERITGISHQQIGKCLTGQYISAGGYCFCKKTDWFDGWKPREYKDTNKKEVYCVETNQKFNTLKEACLETGINISSISECCNKKLNTAGGLHWCFYCEYINGTYMLPQNKNFKKIVCIETKEVFDKIEDASSKYGIFASNISDCLKNPSHTSGGFHWCYYDNYSKNYQIPKQRMKIMRSVRNVETKVIFDSIREAAIYFGINEQNIYRACKNKKNTAGGYHWEYVDK